VLTYREKFVQNLHLCWSHSGAGNGTGFPKRQQDWTGGRGPDMKISL
jgi:hypothetical protein